jgi:hypothetical protein
MHTHAHHLSQKQQNKDDGTFYMEFRDFCSEFRSIMVCRPRPEDNVKPSPWHDVLLAEHTNGAMQDTWKNGRCGGSSYYATVVKSPQYKLVVPSACKVIVCCEQNDTRGTIYDLAAIAVGLWDLDGKLVTKQTPMRKRLVRNPEGYRRRREVSFTTQLEPKTYTVLASQMRPSSRMRYPASVEHDFCMRVWATDPGVSFEGIN